MEKENYFNEKYNIIGDYDLIMRISKYAIAKSFNETLIFVHNNNLSKLNKEMHYYEYKIGITDKKLMIITFRLMKKIFN